MATPKPLKIATKPSTRLGFLLGAVLIAFAVFVAWQVRCVPAAAPYNLQAPQWVVAAAALTAMAGWIVAAGITVRNSVKQHTINTLLQSRLSTAYMANADKVSKHYGDYDNRKRADPTLTETPTDNVDELALRYILNYFEFIAIGIKLADLDESLLRDSLRGILKKNVAMSRLWINGHRKGSPTLYENLAALHARWLPDEPQLE